MKETTRLATIATSKQASECPGGAVAIKCSSAGGPRVTLVKHMKELWGEIGYTPQLASYFGDGDDYDTSSEAEDGDDTELKEEDDVQEHTASKTSRRNMKCYRNFCVKMGEHR